MKYNDLIIDIEKRNKKVSISARNLIKMVLKTSDFDEVENRLVSKNEYLRINKVINRLDNNEPIQYILGQTHFYGYLFFVSKDVLIPRFETEGLVERTIHYIKNYFANDIEVVDVGTGSGAIGITLKKKVPNINVTLTDISSKALQMAKKNATNLKVNTTLIKGNMLEPLIKKEKKYDVLVSNPPYIGNDEEVMDIVKNNEPHIALYGGEDGLKYYRIILENAKKILKDKSLIALEIGASQKKEMIKLIKSYYQNSQYKVEKDLQGRDRMIFIFNNINV